MSHLADLHRGAVASDDRADWQRLWQALAGTRLVLPVEDPDARSLRPRLVHVGGVEAVQAFERMEDYAALLDAPSGAAEIDGAELAEMLTGHGLALAVTVPELAEPILVAAEALAWIATTYRATVDRTDEAGVTVTAPDAPAPELIALLGQTVGALGTDCPEAWLVSLVPPDGPGELALVLGLADRARVLEGAIAETVTRAVQSGTDRPIAVASADRGSPLLDRARRHGIGIGGAEPELERST